jgi:hypothetical protein
MQSVATRPIPDWSHILPWPLLTLVSHTSAPPATGHPASAASKAILALEGVVDHGLFLDMVDVCIIAGTTGVEVGDAALC